MDRRAQSYREKQRQRDVELHKQNKGKLQSLLKRMASGGAGLSSYQDAVWSLKKEDKEKERRDQMRLSFSTIYRAKEKKKRDRRVRNQRKREILMDKLSLINVYKSYPDYCLESVRKKELEHNDFLDNHAFILNFDVNKRILLSEYLMMGYTDYSYNTSLEDIIAVVRNKTTYQLLLELREIALKPLTGESGVKTSSSGRAGGGVIIKGSYEELSMIRQELYDTNRGLRRFIKSWEKKKFVPYRYRKEEHIGMQFIRVGGRSIFNRISFRELLLFANAVMWNVTEVERVDFYSKFYELIDEELPDLLYLLPDASEVF